MNRFIILFLFSLGILSTCVFAVEVIPLNEGWNFHRGFQAPASEIVKVTLPHTWNAGDGMFGMPIIIGDYAITVVSCLFLPIIGANVFS